jgi:cell division protein FtsA
MDANEENVELTVGLDIGTTKIVAMVGQRNSHGKIEILGIGKSESTGVQEGVVVNVDKTVAAIKKAVAAAEEESGTTIQTVSVGIAGQHIKSQQNRAMLVRDNPDITISKVDLERLTQDMFRLTTDPNERIIQVVPQYYTIDNSIRTPDPVGALGCNLEGYFHVITGQVTAAKHIQRCVTDAGLITDNLILEPIASSVSVLSEQEKEAGVVLVDIGGGTTDVAVFYDGIIRHTAVIPFGGEIITSDVMQGCGIIRTYAEMLKIKYGYAITMDKQRSQIISIPGLQGRTGGQTVSVFNLASIINARMEEILEQVLHHIENSGYRDKMGAGLVLTGGGANLKYLKSLSELVTGMDTRIGLPTQHISGEKSKDVASPIYATSVGLMMMGFDRVRQHQQKQEKQAGVLKPSSAKGFINTLLNFFVDERDSSLN